MREVEPFKLLLRKHFVINFHSLTRHKSSAELVLSGTNEECAAINFTIVIEWIRMASVEN